MNITDKTPLGLTQIYNPGNDTTEVSFSYMEDADIEYFVLEYWDEDKRKYVPYDGQYGIIKKQK
jgi:hypothetical protein